MSPVALLHHHLRHGIVFIPDVAKQLAAVLALAAKPTVNGHPSRVHCPDTTDGKPADGIIVRLRLLAEQLGDLPSGSKVRWTQKGSESVERA